MEYINKNGFVFEYAENDKTKLGEKIRNWLNKDNLGEFTLTSNNTFWFTSVNSYITIPNYIYNYLLKIGKKQGWSYLYDELD